MNKFEKMQNAIPLGPADITFGEQMKTKVPGRELGENELFQFVEESIMKEDDYRTIIDHGLVAWQFPYIASIQNPPIAPDEHMFENVGKRFMQLGQNLGNNIQFWAKQGIPTFFHNSCFPAFDPFSLARGMEDFFYDLYDEPELVKAACNRATKDIIEQTLQNSPKGSSVCIWAMRSSSTFVSPDMFEDAAATQKYCDKLIDLAKDGGMIIRSGCEIPLNAKEENVKTFLNCCR